jgi:hypothetical protein
MVLKNIGNLLVFREKTGIFEEKILLKSHRKKCPFSPYILGEFSLCSLCFILFRFSLWFFEYMLYLMRIFQKKNIRRVMIQMNMYPKIKD